MKPGGGNVPSSTVRRSIYSKVYTTVNDAFATIPLARSSLTSEWNASCSQVMNNTRPTFLVISSFPDATSLYTLSRRCRTRDLKSRIDESVGQSPLS